MAGWKIGAFYAVCEPVDATKPEVLPTVAQEMVPTLLRAEVHVVGWSWYGEPSPHRVNARNRYRSRRWDTREDSIALEIPTLREGTCFPSLLLEPRRRAKQALIGVLAERPVLGGSTRKVDGLVQRLWIVRLWRE